MSYVEPASSTSPAGQQPHRALNYHLSWEEKARADPSVLVTHEWLVTNGLGGYASGTIAGIPTRRYHGLLIAALPVPLGRTMLLNHVVEEFRLPGGRVLSLDGCAHSDGTYEFQGTAILKDFRLEAGLPVWRYTLEGFELEKRILMPHRQNTTYVHYRLISGPGNVRLRVRPSVHFRPHEFAVAPAASPACTVVSTEQGIEIQRGDFPPLRIRLANETGAMVLQGGRLREIFYPVERARGYDFKGTLWSPGYFRADIGPGGEAALVASTESWTTLGTIPAEEAMRSESERRERLLAAAPRAAQASMPAQLVLAADQFIITPVTRPADAARCHALGDEVRSIIAGYHWFTDWGRDTMISLEGLCLDTGRHVEAGYILRCFAHHVRDGLIPNLFPEGKNEGLYHTADATLWFFHATDRYLQATGDRATLEKLLPTFQGIVEQHLKGTRFGIHVDPRDGLLVQGAQGYQLTWMDAKVGDWVVTPRRGKAVEINALWYNALRLMESWTEQSHGSAAAQSYADRAEMVRRSFNERFWYPAGGYLYDVVDGENGDDPTMRPNQILSLSLPHAVLDQHRWYPVLTQVVQRLVTPMGLRSLAPGEKDYKARYDGDLRARDAAYHQGTVWGWLIGPLIDAWLKVHPEDLSTARDFLVGFEPHLSEACLGSISEVFDAEAPYTSRGCVAQAWSVAEVLRAWVKTHREP